MVWCRSEFGIGCQTKVVWLLHFWKLQGQKGPNWLLHFWKLQGQKGPNPGGSDIFSNTKIRLKETPKHYSGDEGWQPGNAGPRGGRCREGAAMRSSQTATLMQSLAGFAKQYLYLPQQLRIWWVQGQSYSLATMRSHWSCRSLNLHVPKPWTPPPPKQKGV